MADLPEDAITIQKAAIMKPIRRILVPVDFSEASQHALNYALHLAEAFDSELLLLHVINPFFPSHPSLLMPSIEEKTKQELDRDLAELIPERYRERISVEVQTVSGETEDEIERVARELSTDMVVMGSHGRRRFKRWFIGSVTEHLLRRLPIPVLTVSRLEEDVEPPLGVPLRFKRITCPTDFSDSHEVGLPVAAELARRFKATLEIVHVVEHLHRSPTSPPYTEEELAKERQSLIDWADRNLDEVLAQVDTDDIEIVKTVLEGRASQVLLDHLGESRADLVVMTLHGMGFLERALLGATAERIVRAAPIPVLSIPRLDTREERPDGGGL
jgi:nucleotide-binding universal stress UspA family protein